MKKKNSVKQTVCLKKLFLLLFSPLFLLLLPFCSLLVSVHVLILVLYPMCTLCTLNISFNGQENEAVTKNEIEFGVLSLCVGVTGR